MSSNASGRSANLSSHHQYRPCSLQEAGSVLWNVPIKTRNELLSSPKGKREPLKTRRIATVSIGLSAFFKKNTNPSQFLANQATIRLFFRIFAVFSGISPSNGHNSALFERTKPPQVVYRSLDAESEYCPCQPNATDGFATHRTD